MRLAYFDEWRRGFLNGLRRVSAEGNLYIAAVFHNVLATYYLNRAAQTSPYQVEKLMQREVFLDTNILYSLLVPASSYHDVTRYFIERLNKMGILARILLVTLGEYEEHLAFVERNTDARGQPSPLLVRRNPWVWQEYRSNPARYLQSFAVCRETFSVAGDLAIEEKNYAALSERLKAKGVQLEMHVNELSDEDVEALWLQLRNTMTSDWWDLEKYWDFILRDRPQQVKRHDMMCITNVEKKANTRGTDELGPKVMLVTADKKLWRLRRLYPFILSAEQFLEFVLPYLFLSDIPVTDAERFPNQLLHAQLGTLLVTRPPELAEIVGAYFKDPGLASGNVRAVFGEMGETMARALSSQRFRDLVSTSKDLGDAQREKLTEEAAEILQRFVDETRRTKEITQEVEELRKEIDERDSKIEKLHRTVRYWREQARGKT